MAKGVPVSAMENCLKSNQSKAMRECEMTALVQHSWMNSKGSNLDMLENI